MPRSSPDAKSSMPRPSTGWFPFPRSQGTLDFATTLPGEVQPVSDARDARNLNHNRLLIESNAKLV